MSSSLFFRPKSSSYCRETIDILRLYRSENVGARTFKNLIELFGNASKALENIAEYSLRGGRSKPIKVYSEADAKKEIDKLDKIGATLLTYNDADYPRLLKHISDFPPVLSCLGNTSLLNNDKIIAIVGARSASINGKSFAKKLANELIENGFITTSGLARGIDTAVHSVDCSKTIAVVAGGVDTIYPPENAKLYEKISQEGLIIAEHAIGTKIVGSYFPMRNRIISGIANGTAVIEASLKSGSLITAKFAIEQNRDVFAMPGFPLDPRSQGTNSLIKDGAFLLQSAEDIISNISSLIPSNSTNTKKSLAEFTTNDNNFRFQAASDEVIVKDADRKTVIDLLSSTPISIESIISETKMPIAMVYTICLELELAGKISRHPGGRISLTYRD